MVSGLGHDIKKLILTFIGNDVLQEAIWHLTKGDIFMSPNLANNDDDQDHGYD